MSIGSENRESSTELVPVNGDLAAREAAEMAAAITELGRQGDIGRLRQVAEEIDARVVYFHRQALSEAITRGVHLRTLAEAELGAIMRRDDWPEELEATPKERTFWTAFAVARERGVLDKAIRLSLARGHLSSRFVYQETCMLGVLHVPPGVLRKPFLASGLSYAALARASGVHRDTVATLAGGQTKNQRIGYALATRVAVALGVEPSTLPHAHRIVNVTKRRRRWIHRKLKLEGGRWDDAYGKFHAALQAFAKVAGEGVQWDDAYSHWYELNKVIKNAADRDAYGLRDPAP